MVGFGRFRLSLVASASLLVTCVVIGVAPAASGGTRTRFSGVAPGSIACDVTATLRLRPPLSSTEDGGEMATIRGRLTECKAGNPAITVSHGALVGSFSQSPLACPAGGPTGVGATLTVTWKAKVNGTIVDVSYDGPAHLTPSAIAYSGGHGATDSDGHVGVILPASGDASNTVGSFDGGSNLALFTRYTAAKFASACARPKGITRLTLTGSFTHGLVTTYEDPGIDYSGAIAEGPNGDLWFANNGTNFSIGRITTEGDVTTYTDPTLDYVADITAGPDGAMWFTNQHNNSIGRISTSGAITNYTDPSINLPGQIVAGSDGALWFTNYGNNSIGRITTAGVVSNFGDPSIVKPSGIAAGPDDALWFTNGNNSIGRITTGGTVTNFTAPGILSPVRIVAGPDGALWFTNDHYSLSSIGRITTSGAVTTYQGYGIGWPVNIAVGPDDAMWFTTSYDAIGRITTTGEISNYTDPAMNVPQAIAAGPDNAMWFTNEDSIGRVTP